MKRRTAMVLTAIAAFESTIGNEIQKLWRRTMEFTSYHLIESFESCALKAYPDHGSIWTIGWGHTKGVKEGDTCTQAQADAWLKADVAWAQSVANSALTPPVHPTGVRQGVFDAFTDFVFNCGAKHADNLVAKIHMENWVGACDELMRFVHDAEGNVPAGLVRRRKAEIELITHAMGFVYTPPLVPGDVR